MHDLRSLLLLLLVPLINAGVEREVRAEIGIISPAEAQQWIASAEGERPVVLDTRGGYKDYFQGHLPTAHHLNFDTLRGTDRGIPVQYLPDDLTAALLVRAGVDRDRPHLIYATGDRLPNDEILSSTMVAHVLEKFGVRQIRILDGGLAGWKEANLPVTQEYFGNPAGRLPERTKLEVGIDVEELVRIHSRPDVLLVDARPRNEYLGQDDIWVRKGHIPGAISFHWARVMEPENTHRFLPVESMLPEFEQAGITPDKEIIVYCGTSREGSLLRFYLRHLADYPRVRLYEGSWKEYAAMKEHPAELSESKAR
jgi:thiosulfate/3-mercaptopyruvate sulfurtransferase